MVRLHPKGILGRLVKGVEGRWGWGGGGGCCGLDWRWQMSGAFLNVLSGETPLYL